MDTTFQIIVDKMKKEGLSELLIENFLSRVEKVRKGETGKVDWETIGDLDPVHDEITLDEIRDNYNSDPDHFKKLVVIKLNGGLGTSMGLSYAKSLIPVKDDLSFLDIIAKQIEYIRNKFSAEIPLIFMDSFSTQKDCSKRLSDIGFKQSIPTSFLQNKVPRIKTKDFSPITCSDPKEEWCPPGHGDIWLSLKQTGLLQTLIQKGYEYAFVSNGDNLGATVDMTVLEYLVQNELEFAMEMTPKTLADLKGGAIYRKTVNGQFVGLELLETAQVPDDKMNEFTGMDKFRSFSTNNLWISLKALDKVLNNKKMDLSLIVNPKNIDGIDVLQLESAMGSAIGSFSKTKGIIIPRSRFAPVKKCEDLLVRMSDAYILDEDYSITMNPKRFDLKLGENLVTLDDAHYKKFNEFKTLFKVIPSLVESSSFKVEGKVEFDVSINIIGDVKIVNHSKELKKISSLKRSEFKDEEVNL